MNARLLRLSTDGMQIVEESLAEPFTCGLSDNPQIIALALDNAISLFHHYRQIAIKGDIPLILNPGIPLEKLKEMACLLGAKSLMTGEESFELASQVHELKSGHHIL